MRRWFRKKKRVDDELVQTWNRFAALCRGPRKSEWDFLCGEINNAGEYAKIQEQVRVVSGKRTVYGMTSILSLRAEVRGCDILVFELKMVHLFSGAPEDVFGFLEDLYDSRGLMAVLLRTWELFEYLCDDLERTGWELENWGVEHMEVQNRRFAGLVEGSRIYKGESGMLSFHLEVLGNGEIRTVLDTGINVFPCGDAMFCGRPRQVFQYLNGVYAT
jgi:hypothetical protein